MIRSTTARGFDLVAATTYPPVSGREQSRVVQQSSAVGNYPDAFDRPGSSALWVGEHHHLNREQVAELVGYLTHWLTTGHLFDREASIPG